jgi:hypothetical protein
LWIAINLLHYCHDAAEKSYCAVIARFTRVGASDSCLLQHAMTTGTLAARAEEYMCDERVIAHSIARTLNLADRVAGIFYLLLCCTKSLSRLCHMLQKCESSNRLNTLLVQKQFCVLSPVTAQCRKSNFHAVFAVAGRKSRATF